MANTTLSVTFEPRSTGSGTHCYVLVTWPNGRTVHLGDFKSETDANTWIDRSSKTWLTTFPESERHE